LKAGFEDVEGVGEEGCGHAADAGREVLVLGGELQWGADRTYPPATKCCHDFAPGAGLVVTEAASVFVGGMISPSSRDCVRVSASVSGFLLIAADLVDGYWEVMHGRFE